MREINTKWGKIYIEDYEFDRHKPYQREEEDRIKLFDSDKRYLDYYDADMTREEYDDICEGIEKSETLDNFLYEMQFHGTWKEVYDWIYETFDIHEEFCDENGIPNNEYVNRIGETYIIHEDY